MAVKRTFNIPNNMAKTASHISMDFHRRGASNRAMGFQVGKKRKYAAALETVLDDKLYFGVLNLGPCP